MRLAETGYTKEDIKGLVAKYMIDTYERFPMIAEHAEDMYIYDENGEAYLDFYAGIAVNSAGSCNKKVVAAVKDQVDDIMHTFNYHTPSRRRSWRRRSVRRSAWTRSSSRIRGQRPMRR